MTPDEPPIDSPLTPERAVRLLRAKAAENESRVMVDSEYRRRRGMRGSTPQMDLAADVALIATLLADEIERNTDPGPPGPWSPWAGTEPHDG